MKTRTFNMWPLLVFGLPGFVVVASIITVIVAFKTADSPVSDNAYKDGLAINKSFKSQKTAKLLSITATIAIKIRESETEKTLKTNESITGEEDDRGYLIEPPKKPHNVFTVDINALSQNLPDTISVKFEHPLQEQRDFSLILLAEKGKAEKGKERGASNLRYQGPIHAVEGRWYLTISGRKPQPWEIKSEVKIADIQVSTIQIPQNVVSLSNRGTDR